jgi:hypothetical protein
MSYLRPEDGFMEPHVKCRIKKTLFGEFLGLQYTRLVPLHEPQTFCSLGIVDKANICSFSINIYGLEIHIIMSLNLLQELWTQ